MTEIQFLLKIMLDETASNEIKTKCAQRINELEQLRANQTIFQPLIYTGPNLTMPLPYIGPSAADSCQHEYPTMWGGTMPPACTKCGKQINTNGTLIIDSLNPHVQVSPTSNSATVNNISLAK